MGVTEHSTVPVEGPLICLYFDIIRVSVLITLYPVETISDLYARVAVPMVGGSLSDTEVD